ncbi:hypothetical protein HMN09_00368500 [Mycena chlorophos]|uniref:Uncharacterized protein n=1 Tax=Mycena chlorophos TaxID=658473 RepID=A0A8H6TMV5_MYCCL|nr:hypothetical protein HMN09_00368500 [Mycena chlorophos]
MDAVFDLKALNSLSAPVRKCAKQLLKVELENPGPEDRFSDYAALGPLGLAPGFRARSVDQLRLLPVYWRLLDSALPSAHHLDVPQPRCTFHLQIIILALLGIGEVTEERLDLKSSRLLMSRMLPWVLFLHEHYASLPRLCHLREQTEEDILCAFLRVSMDVVQEDVSLLATPGITRIIFRTWALTLDNDSSPPLGRTPPLPPHLSMYQRGIFTPAHVDEIVEALGGRLEEIPKLVASTVKRVLRCWRTARRAGTTSSLEVDFALWLLGPVRTTLETLEVVIPSLDSLLSRTITGKLIGETLDELSRNANAQRSKMVRESLTLTTLLYILAQITTVKRVHLVAALERNLLRSIAILCQTLPAGDHIATSVVEFSNPAEDFTATDAFRRTPLFVVWETFYEMFTTYQQVFVTLPDLELKLGSLSRFTSRELHDIRAVMTFHRERGPLRWTLAIRGPRPFHLPYFLTVDFSQWGADDIAGPKLSSGRSFVSPEEVRNLEGTIPSWSDWAERAARADGMMAIHALRIPFGMRRVSDILLVALRSNSMFVREEGTRLLKEIHEANPGMSMEEESEEFVREWEKIELPLGHVQIYSY